MAWSISRSAAGAQGYDLIVGPKGSRLELVLNTVYHLGKPIGSVPFSYYTDLADARFASYVERAVPICMGDGYKGFRVIGTLPDMFKLEYLDGEKYQFQEVRRFSWDGWSEAVVGATAARKAGLQVGKTFRSMHGEDEDSESEHEQQIDFKVVGVLKPTGTPTDRAIFVNLAGFFRLHGFAEYYYEDHNGQNCAQFPIGSALPEMFEKAAAPGGEKYKFTAGGNLHQDAPFEAVIGANVAQKTRLKPGDTIYPTSVATGPLQNHVIKIVGVLAPTKSPHDDGIFMHEAGLAQIRGAGDPPAHKAAEGEQPAPHLDKEPKISAILIASNNEDITRAAEFPSKISEELDAQAVAPVKEIAALLEGIVGNIQLVLLILAVLIVVVAGIGILVSIYNSMNDRRHEIAVMRPGGSAEHCDGHYPLGVDPAGLGRRGDWLGAGAQPDGDPRAGDRGQYPRKRQRPAVSGLGIDPDSGVDRTGFLSWISARGHRIPHGRRPIPDLVAMSTEPEPLLETPLSPDEPLQPPLSAEPVQEVPSPDAPDEPIERRYHAIHGFAVASLILGGLSILSLLHVLLGLIPIAGIAFARLAMKRISTQSGGDRGAWFCPLGNAAVDWVLAHRFGLADLRVLHRSPTRIQAGGLQDAATPPG